MKTISKLLMVMFLAMMPEFIFTVRSIKELSVQEEKRKIALRNAQQDVKQAQADFLNATVRTRVTLARKLVRVAEVRNNLLVPQK